MEYYGCYVMHGDVVSRAAKNVMMYGVEVRGWKGQESSEVGQMKYYG
jgi:hypothetical protein